MENITRESRNAAARSAIVAAIQAAGAQASNKMRADQLVRIAQRVFGARRMPGETAVDFFFRAAVMRPVSRIRGSGQIAENRQPTPFRQLRVERHLRQDEIDSLPSIIPAGWVGNGFQLGKEGTD